MSKCIDCKKEISRNATRCRSCASFDLTKPEEQKKCFHYINLQPLWAFDNMSKGVKF